MVLTLIINKGGDFTEDYLPVHVFHLFGYNLELTVNIVVQWGIILIVTNI